MEQLAMKRITMSRTVAVFALLTCGLWMAGCPGTNSSGSGDATTGSTGSDGSSSADTTTGTDGTAATDGTDGTSAVDGTSGQDAADATSGTDGTSATDATDGPACDPPCTGLDQCVNGACQTPQICEAGTWVCNGLVDKKQCNESGTGFLEPESCPGEQLCSAGQCGLKCTLDPKWGAYVGCVFWTVDLPVWDDPTLPNANTLPHAVVVSNPNEFEAQLTFTPPPGVTFEFDDLVVPGLQTRVFEFPSLDTSGSDIHDLGIRLEANRPVLVHQFNPWDNTFSNDASLLLPEALLGKEHLVLSWPTDARSLIEIPGLPNFGGPSAHGFVSVVAPFDGTEVIVRTTARVNGTEIPEGADPATYPVAVNPMAPNTVQIFTLNAGQVLNLDAMPENIFETADLTGTLIKSDKPVAVFSGHDSAAIAAPSAPTFPGDEPEDDGCCLDHLEEQMLPLNLLGTKYLAGKTKPRGGETDLWRIVAADNNVQILTNPPIDGLHGKTIAQEGEWIEAFTDQSFELTATGRVLVGQYLVAQGQTDQGTGDPSMFLAVPMDRFRTAYPIMVPSSYSKNYVTVIRPAGEAVQVDGFAIPDSEFDSFAGGGWEIGYVSLSHGFHTITSAEPFSLSAYGYDSAASYGYPGGMTIPGEANP